jgi:8-oxo-dGTP diphosphatase
MKVRPAILIIENNQILTMQYRYAEQDVYNLPGGNLELFETMADTLAREMVEELGLEVAVGKMILLGEIIQEAQSKSALHAVFEGKILKGSPILNPKETSAKSIVWLPIEDLLQYNMYPNVGGFIQQHLANKLQNPYVGPIEQAWF